LQAELAVERCRSWEAWEELAQWHEQWERLPRDPETASPTLEGVRAVDGAVEIGFRPTHAFRLVSAALLKMLDDRKTPNCIESVMTYQGGTVVVEVRRLLGKSMGQLRAEALHERDVARAELARMKALPGLAEAR